MFPNHHHIRCKYTHQDCLLNRKLCKPAKCGPMVGKFYLYLLHQRRGRMKQKLLDLRAFSMEQKCTNTSHIFPKAQVTFNQILENYVGKDLSSIVILQRMLQSTKPFRKTFNFVRGNSLHMEKCAVLVDGLLLSVTN